MYRLVRDYYENNVEETETILSSDNKQEIIDKFEEELQKDKDFGYVEDLEYNKEYRVRLFLDYQENWNNYIEMYISKN